MTMKAEIQKIDMKVIPRVETGPMEFSQDWPATFIRGDDSFGYAMALRALLESDGSNPGIEYIARAQVQGLIELLESCNINAEQNRELIAF